MFKLVYAMQPIGEYPTFEQAFVELYKKLNHDLENNEMSWQVLETTIWIEKCLGVPPMMFYEARDHAHEIGLLTKTGQLNKEMVKKFE